MVQQALETRWKTKDQSWKTSWVMATLRTAMKSITITQIVTESMSTCHLLSVLQKLKLEKTLKLHTMLSTPTSITVPIFSYQTPTQTLIQIHSTTLGLMVVQLLCLGSSVGSGNIITRRRRPPESHLNATFNHLASLSTTVLCLGLMIKLLSHHRHHHHHLYWLMAGNVLWLSPQAENQLPGNPLKLLVREHHSIEESLGWFILYIINTLFLY